MSTAAETNTRCTRSIVRLGARLTDFGGWEMPLHYGSQIEEHHRVRRDAGMFDVSHMLAIDVEGPRRAVSCVAAGKRRGQSEAAGQGALLLPAGDRRRRARRSDRLLPRAGRGSGWWSTRALRTRIWPGSQAQRDRLASGVGLQPAARPRHDRRAGPRRASDSGRRGRIRARSPKRLRCSKARTLRRHVRGAHRLYRRGRIRGDAARTHAVALWRDLLGAGVAPCGLGARDTLRLEAG